LAFLDVFAWIEDKNTNQAIRFQLWPMQRECIGTLVDSSRLLILKARQLGWTWLVAAYCLWLVIFYPLQEILVISMGETEAKEFLHRVRFMLQRLPDWLLLRAKTKVVKDTSEYLEFEHIDDRGKEANSIIKSLPTTQKGGQSKTPTCLIVDEACWNRYFREAYNATKPGIDAAGGKIIIISNSIKNAPGWPFMRLLYTQAMRGKLDAARLFLPWWANPSRPTEQVWSEDDKEYMPLFKLNQLNEGMDEDSFSQHYPETEQEAISSMLGSYFGKALARHESTADGTRGNLHRDPKTKEIVFEPDRRGLLEVWRFPYHLVDSWAGDWWAGRYCGGSDVSEGLGQSYSVAYIKDRHLDEIVCRIRSNRVDAYTWADMLNMLSEWYQNAIDYLPDGGLTHERALLCVERTGAGQTTVKRLKELGANQYVRQLPGKVAGEWTKEYGWSETEQAKHDLSEDLRKWLRVCRGTVYDAVLLDECSTWIQYEGTRRLGPEEGHYGDCVIAAGCTEQASIFMGGSPKRLEPPLTGWRARLKEARERETGWTV